MSKFLSVMKNIMEIALILMLLLYIAMYHRSVKELNQIKKEKEFLERLLKPDSQENFEQYENSSVDLDAVFNI